MLTSEKMSKQSLLKRRKEVDAYSLTYDSGGGGIRLKLSQID